MYTGLEKVVEIEDSYGQIPQYPWIFMVAASVNSVCNNCLIFLGLHNLAYRRSYTCISSSAVGEGGGVEIGGIEASASGMTPTLQ